MSFLTHDKRILKPGRFFFLVDLAGLLFMIWVVLLATDTGGSFRVLLTLAWTLLLFVMFFRRGQDEFWDACWRRGTSAAFLALIVVPVTWGFIDGMIAGFTTEHARDIANAAGAAPPASAGADDGPSFDAIVTLLFAAFFVTFEWTRFRGGAR